MSNFNWETFFSEWEAEYEFDIFCRDGIVDSALYFSDTVPHKVLFVLKDVHIPDQTKKEIRAKKRIVDMRKEVFFAGEGKPGTPLHYGQKHLPKSRPFLLSQ